MQFVSVCVSVWLWGSKVDSHTLSLSVSTVYVRHDVLHANQAGYSMRTAELTRLVARKFF